MLMATMEQKKGSDKRDAVALAVWWGEALYMKGFVLVDLGRTDEARAQFERLLKLEPYHSQVLSELGNLSQSAKDWPKALDYFTRAQDAAASSPDAQKVSDTARALRGQDSSSSSSSESTKRKPGTASAWRWTRTTTRQKASWSTSASCARLRTSHDSRSRGSIHARSASVVALIATISAPTTSTTPSTSV